MSKTDYCETGKLLAKREESDCGTDGDETLCKVIRTAISWKNIFEKRFFSFPILLYVESVSAESEIRFLCDILAH